MTNLNLCPTPVDIYIQQGDIEPFTFTIRASDWTIVDLTGLNFEMYLYVAAGGTSQHSHDTDPDGVAIEPEIIVGNVTDAIGGVVEFALDSNQAATEHGSYFYEIICIDNLVERTVINGLMTFVEDNCSCLPPTQVEICNMALSFIGSSATLQSVVPPDPSAEAALCAQFYPIALNTVLEMHPWSFATKLVVLEEHPCDRDEWEFCYMLPHDYLKALAVLPPGSSDDYKDAQEFSIEQDDDGTTRLFTDVEDAVLKYTMCVTSTRSFPPTFAMALAWHLGSLLSGPIVKGKEGVEMSNRCLQMMRMYSGKSASLDSTDRRVRPVHTPTWMADR